MRVPSSSFSPRRSARFLAHPAAAAAVLLVLAGCRSLKAEPVPPYEVEVHVSSDPGSPVPHAVLSVAGRLAATTDGRGAAILELSGSEGESVDVVVTCPEGYRPASKPLRVTLRRLESDRSRLQYAAQCPPKVRTTVVVVRAENGANLPILRLGKEIGRTNEEGAAHLLIQAENQEQIELVLDTREKGKELLRPQNPAFGFVVKDQDELLVFDQKFTIERAKTAPVVIPKAKGPTRLPPHGGAGT